MPNQVNEVLTGSAARKKILSGVNKVLEVIKPTLGPAGRSVLLPRTYNRGQRIADDGFFAAENVLLKDPHERLAAEAFKEGIQKTNRLAGDGTTGTGVLSGTLVNETFRIMPDPDMPVALGKQADTRSVRQLRKEMLDAKDLVIEAIKSSKKDIKTLADLERIALVSLGKEDDTVAKQVAKIVWDVARDAAGNYIDNHIEVTEGYKGTIETEVIRGMRFPAKVPAQAFVNRPERNEMVVEDTPVLIINSKIDNPILLVKLIGEGLKLTKLTIFAPDFSPSVLISLNKSAENGFFIYPVKVPALRTVQLEDLAAYTGATVIDKDAGKKLENAMPSDLGFASKIVVKSTENREDAILLGGKGEKSQTGKDTKIDERLKILKGQLKESRNDTDRAQLEKRIANLGSAVGIVRVGSSTNADTLFMKLKIEDAVYACKGALEEGYVTGGGLCLKTIAEKLPKNILTEALKAPYETIQKNAGGSLEIGKDIIDPAKVVRMIVEHAVSVAATLITVHAIAAEIPEKSPGEGYADIAKAINRFAYFDAKHKGLIKANEDEVQSDLDKEFERVLENDNG